MTDIRDAYFDALLARMNYEPKKSMLLTVDMGARSLTVPHLTREANIINVGVSEQNAVSVAAGLSSRGITAFVYGISAFIVNRARAQIRHDAVIGNNPVHLIGSGPGLSYDRDGPSHHSLDDIALMLTLPNTVVFSPFDAATCVRAAEIAFMVDHTTYCRLDRGSFPDLSSALAEKNGIYQRQRDTQRWVITSGIMTHEALKFANRHDYSVASLFAINERAAHSLSLLLPRGAHVEIVDESHECGGLMQIVANANLHHGLDLNIVGTFMRNKFVQEKMPRSKLYEAYTR